MPLRDVRNTILSQGLKFDLKQILLNLIFDR